MTKIRSFNQKRLSCKGDWYSMINSLCKHQHIANFEDDWLLLKPMDRYPLDSFYFKRSVVLSTKYIFMRISITWALDYIFLRTSIPWALDFMFLSIFIPLIPELLLCNEDYQSLFKRNFFSSINRTTKLRIC